MLRSPGHLEQLAAPLELDRRAGVVLEEVDRLADVGVGLAPRLRALAHLKGGELEPPLSQPGGGAAQDFGTLGRGPRGPVPVPARGRLHGRGGVRLGRPPRLRHHSRGRARIGGFEPGVGPLRAPDQHGHAQRQPGVQLAQRLEQRVADGRPPQLEDRLVRERRQAHGAASSSSSSAPSRQFCRNDSLEVFSSSRRTR